MSSPAPQILVTHQPSLSSVRRSARIRCLIKNKRNHSSTNTHLNSFVNSPLAFSSDDCASLDELPTLIDSTDEEEEVVSNNSNNSNNNNSDGHLGSHPLPS